MEKQMHYLLVGYPFSGKTTLSKQLAERFGFVRLNIDDIKFEKGYAHISDADVPDAMWQEIFAEMDRRLTKYLHEGKAVLNENAWMKKEWRDGKRHIASSVGVPTKLIYVTTSEEVVRERRSQNIQSNKRFHVPDDVFEEAIREFEIPLSEEDVILYTPETDFEEWVAENF